MWWGGLGGPVLRSSKSEGGSLALQDLPRRESPQIEALACPHPGSRTGLLVAVPQKMKHAVSHVAQQFRPKGDATSPAFLAGHVDANDDFAPQPRVLSPRRVSKRKRQNIRRPSMREVSFVQGRDRGLVHEHEPEMCPGIGDVFGLKDPEDDSPCGIGRQGSETPPGGKNDTGRTKGAFPGGVLTAHVRKPLCWPAPWSGRE